jgi:hypothetical protein
MGGFRPGGEPWPPAGAPLNVEDWEAASLIRGQLARLWPGEDPAPAAAEETPAPAVVTPEPADVRFDTNIQQWVKIEPEPQEAAQPEAPKPASPKTDWVNWAIRQGATADEANAATKAELMETYGDRS